MASWEPRQAAEFKADAATLFCERLEASAQARRGLHRLLGIARAHGRSTATIAGIRFDAPDAPLHTRVIFQQRRQETGDRSVSGSHARKPRKKTEARKQKEQEKLEAKWQRRKEQQQQSLLPPQPPPPPLPGLQPQPTPSFVTTPTSTIPSAVMQQPEGMDDSEVVSHVAGGKRDAPSTSTAAKLAALLAKKSREVSPRKGMNPDAIAFRPPASSEQSVQQIGDAAFTRTFSRPASSSTTSQNGSGSHDADDVRPSASGHSAQGGTNSGSSEAG